MHFSAVPTVPQSCTKSADLVVFTIQFLFYPQRKLTPWSCEWKHCSSCSILQCFIICSVICGSLGPHSKFIRINQICKITCLVKSCYYVSVVYELSRIQSNLSKNLILVVCKVHWISFWLYFFLDFDFPVNETIFGWCFLSFANEKRSFVLYVYAIFSSHRKNIERTWDFCEGTCRGWHLSQEGN